MKNLVIILLSFAAGAWAMHLLWVRHIKKKAKCGCKGTTPKVEPQPIKQEPITPAGGDPVTVGDALGDAGINV